jgi:hypothetical protein
VLLSALAFKRLADDDLAGSQLSSGTPTSLPQDQVLINSLSHYSSFLVLQAQHAARGYCKVTISVLRESQIDMPMEQVEDYRVNGCACSHGVSFERLLLQAR